jgi:hypothetical protein
VYRLGVLLTGDMAVFVQARDAEEYMVDDGWKAVETHRNGNGHEEAIAASNGHDAEAPEREQSLFSWAEFMAEEPVKSKVRSRKPKPAAASLFEWAYTLVQALETDPVGAGR